jgi:leader peptidase (prepilin peptidase)/N-methyltransferase
LFFAWKLGLTFEFAAAAFLTSALIAIFLIDLDFQIIPDLITLPGMALGLAYACAPGGITLLQSSIGLIAGGGALYCIALLGDWLFKKESMGGGDIKMAAMLGAFLGWQKVVLIFVSSAMIGLLVSAVLMLFSTTLRHNRVIPFGPFLALASFVTILYGDRLIAYYVHNFLQQ